jgi:uncharacterized protein
VRDSRLPEKTRIPRRRFLTATAAAAAGFALYSGEIARHQIEITRPEIRLPDLPPAFDGFRMAQLSDIHLDQFTEPFFLRDAVERVNRLNPDAVLLTGDFVTHELLPRKLGEHSAWRCANILDALQCRRRYAVLGNHDLVVGAATVTAALTANAIQVLRNASTALEQGSSRLWIAGLDDAVEGEPDIDKAVPGYIRGRAREPVLMLCHAPDYADALVAHPAGPSVALMISGHTHGGQIRLPLVGALELPALGKKYVEGSFAVAGLQLYVNRGIGTVGLPFRLNCPPEITLITLRRA